MLYPVELRARGTGRILLHLETQVRQAIAAFDLQDNGIAGLQALNCGAQIVHRSDGSCVEGVNDVAGLQASVGCDEIGGTTEDDHAAGNAQGSDLIAQVGGDIDGENAEARDKTLLRIGGIEELIHGVAGFDGGDVKSFPFITPQDFQF